MQRRHVSVFLCGMTAIICFGIMASASAQGVSAQVAERRAALERELTNLESQIADQQKILDDRRRQSVSLERDVEILNAKIERAKLSIRARVLVIERLSREIGEKSKTIDALVAKVEREKESLAELIRKVNRLDSASFAEFILEGRTLSDFFADADSFRTLNNALQESFEVIEHDRVETEDEKEALEAKRQEETGLRTLQELEKKRLEEQEEERKLILKLSKGLEAEYQRIIRSKEFDAAKIRTELFQLRGTAAIPFEKALEYATRASKKTGVRPALILGIIAEESNLGENVGTGSWRVDMKAPRDTVPFLDITRRLGLDPDRMPVSKKPWYGYGGAMGPAQFIPSTWVLYEERITAATGHNPPNPWDPEDAFMAAALLLDDNGAGKGTPAAERLAALRYLAGWANATKKAYAFYGDDVMELAEKYQRQIDILQSS